MELDWNALVFRILLDSSVRIVVVAAAVSAILFIARIRSSSVRHRAWTAVLAAMLAMPLLAAIAPPIGLPYSTTIQSENPAVGQAGTDAAPVPPVYAEGVSPAATAAPPSPMPAANGVPFLRERFPWPALLLVIYIMGVAALFARLLWGLRAMHRLMGSSQAASALDGVAILESDAVSTPLTCGVIRPRIVLPRNWREWPEAKLRVVLAHERAHISRNDALVGFLVRINCAVFWFHPLTWWLERNLAILAEHACDDAVVRETGEPELYATALVEIADNVRRHGERYSSHGLGVYGKGMLRNRIDRLLSGAIPQNVSTRRKVMVGLLCVTAVYLVAACRPEATKQGAVVDLSPSVGQQEWITYRDAKRHFSFQHPAAWKINDEPPALPAESSNIPFFNRYHDIAVSLNSMGMEKFSFRQAQKSTERWEFGDAELIQQLAPGAVYMDVGWTTIPGGFDQFGPHIKEMEAADLSALLKESQPKASSGPLIDRSIGFSKWGGQWLISVYLRAPYTQEQQETAERVLASFRFDSVPAGNEIWATGLAHKHLPPEAEPDRHTRQGGSRLYYNHAKRVVNDVIVTFTTHLEGRPERSWSFDVTATGEVIPIVQGTVDRTIEKIKAAAGLTAPVSAAAPLQAATAGAVSQDQPLRLTIKSDKDVYADAAPIDLVAMLNNSGKAVARIYSPEYWGVSEIVVEDSKGGRVLPRGIKVERTRFEEFMVIPPGEARFQTFRNLLWYHCGGAWEFAGNARLGPGTYTVYVTVTNPPVYACFEDPSNPSKPDDKTDLAGTLTSNKITLRVERK